MGLKHTIHNELFTFANFYQLGQVTTEFFNFFSIYSFLFGVSVDSNPSPKIKIKFIINDIFGTIRLVQISISTLCVITLLECDAIEVVQGMYLISVADVTGVLFNDVV